MGGALWSVAKPAEETKVSDGLVPASLLEDAP